MTPSASLRSGTRPFSLQRPARAKSRDLGAAYHAERSRKPAASCFPLLPPCFPGFRIGAGEAKAAPKGRSYPIEISKKFWSGRRDSNPRPQPWQGCALPLSYARVPWWPVIAIPPRYDNPAPRLCKACLAQACLEGAQPRRRTGPGRRGRHRRPCPRRRHSCSAASTLNPMALADQACPLRIRPKKARRPRQTGSWAPDPERRILDVGPAAPLAAR